VSQAVPEVVDVVLPGACTASLATAVVEVELALEGELVDDEGVLGSVVGVVVGVVVVLVVGLVVVVVGDVDVEDVLFDTSDSSC
jgi:hypothetical protein